MAVKRSAHRKPRKAKVEEAPETTLARMAEEVGVVIPSAEDAAQREAESMVRYLMSHVDAGAIAGHLRGEGYHLGMMMSDCLNEIRQGAKFGDRMRAHRELQRLLERARKNLGLEGVRTRETQTVGGITRTAEAVVHTLEQVRRAQSMIARGLTTHTLPLYDKPTKETANAREATDAEEDTSSEDSQPSKPSDSRAPEIGDRPHDAGRHSDSSGALDSPNPGHNPPTKWLPGGGLTGIPPGARADEWGRDKVHRIGSQPIQRADQRPGRLGEGQGHEGGDGGAGEAKEPGAPTASESAPDDADRLRDAGGGPGRPPARPAHRSQRGRRGAGGLPVGAGDLQPLSVLDVVRRTRKGTGGG